MSRETFINFCNSSSEGGSLQRSWRTRCTLFAKWAWCITRLKLVAHTYENTLTVLTDTQWKYAKFRASQEVKPAIGVSIKSNLSTHLFSIIHDASRMAKWRGISMETKAEAINLNAARPRPTPWIVSRRWLSGNVPSDAINSSVGRSRAIINDLTRACVASFSRFSFHASRFQPCHVC